MRLNCALVALLLWYRARFRSGVGVKRSESLGGLIPHFFHLRERRGRLVIVDYIPMRRKARALGAGDSVLIFHGLFRVRIYRLSAASTDGSLFAAYRGAAGLDRGRRDADR